MKKLNIIFVLFVLLIMAKPALSAENSAEGEKAGEETMVLEPIEVIGEKVELFSGKVSTERVEELQPVDIGDLLKKDVEGITVIRRSGIALDPVLRGMSKDRLNTLVDGGFIFGACANRMDPPTFHITPYGTEGVEVTKGPFDVTTGPGGLGGTINILTKEPKRYEEMELHPEIRGGYDSVSNGLKGGFAFQGGKEPYGFNLSYDYKNYDGYLDGNGKRITTDFKQSNFTAGIDYFLEEDKKIGINYMGQRGSDVYYPTLAMDSPKDDMDMTALSFNSKNLEARIYYSLVDHMMDNTSKSRYVTNPSTMRMDAPSKSRTYGGKVNLNLPFLDGTHVGIDYYNRWWDITLQRWSSAGMRMSDIRAIPDTTIQDFGVFIQPEKKSGNLTLTAGARIDFVKAKANAVGSTEQGYFDTYYGSGSGTSSNLDKSESNTGGFLKGNYNISDGVDVYAGIGRGVRTADPRERFRILLPIAGGKWDIGNPNLNPEENLQFEIGNKIKVGRFNSNISVFHNSIKNYITQFDTGKTFSSQPVMGYRNIDAILYGGELSAGLLATDNVSFIGSTSYTWGENRTENKPLPEIMPWQGKLGIRYDEFSGKYWGELMGRLVANQDRYDSIIDPGTTPGFSTFDIRLGWRVTKTMLLTAGVENLFDKYYYEHTSKNFAFNQDGYKSTDRIPEPGRNMYINLSWVF